MSLINYSNKAKCGPLLSSACVSWEGGYKGVTTADDIPCNASIEDVVNQISTETSAIKNSLDLSAFNPKVIPFDKTTEEIKDLLQDIADLLALNKQILINLQSQIDSIKGGDIDIEIDLSCLATEISNCETPPVYSLKSILELLISKNC